MVEVNSVEKRYGDFYALKSINLSLPTNKVTALIGPSGCGKSTLLRVILGLIEPTSGTVEVDGKKVEAASALSLRREIGYVVQDGGLFPHLTAKRNVTLMMETLGHAEVEINKRLKELCDLTHLNLDLLNRYPGELSGGQRQRIGLMRAMALKPKLLLLDEPLGALDPLIRAGLQTDLLSIFKEGGQTVVFVTHDMGEAAYLADHIVLLREGSVVQQGTVQDFTTKPAEQFVADFMNAQRQVGAIS